MGVKTSALFLALGIASICVSGCHSGAPGPQAASQAENFKTYHLRGKIVSTNNATGEVTVDHEAIPGFMEAMTMPYKVHDTRMIGELHPGDIITADVLVSQNDDAEVYLDHFVIVGQSKPDYRPRVSYHVPTPGDIVPEFSLVNQDGKTIRLSRYRGKALLITFIYTRCPLPDFCPRVTRNFAAIDKALAASPSLFARTHLISASFDPEHDTSDRLKAFGQQ